MTLLEEEAEADVQEEEHLMVLTALAGLLVNEKPRRGGSAPGRLKAKNRHHLELEGYCMLYSDYFADAPLHGKKTFRRHFQMS